MSPIISKVSSAGIINSTSGFNVGRRRPVTGGINVNIVTNGLVLYLDAGNGASYPGYGSTWTDLSGGGNNLTLINSPTWNGSGYFSTGSNGYFAGDGTASVPIGNSSYTMMCWVRLSSWASGRGIISIGGYGTSNQSNAFRTADGGVLGHLSNYWWFNDLNSNNNNGGISDNVWFLATAQFDGTNRRIWVNTTNVASDTPSNHNVLTTTIQIAKTYSTEYLQGDVAVAHIYNRALTSGEITQNFNAFKSRFGL